MIQWIRFEWDLTKGDFDRPVAASHYQLRSASADEGDAVLKVVTSSFSVDAFWADAGVFFGDYLKRSVEACFDGKEVRCIVATHGSRIIGVSALNPSPDAPYHLLTGTCVLHEYRSRGIGSELLRGSLAHLRELGLTTAYAMTLDRSAAAKFVYPKFNGIGRPIEEDPIAQSRLAA